jgi:hypothetical protein
MYQRGTLEKKSRLDYLYMRSTKPRSRSKSNRNRSVGNVVNRVFDSSGPEGKVRGTPQQIIEKYNQLARDAQLSNDRVAAENFQQHAEHYLRLLSEAQREQEQRREQQERENRERQSERDRERSNRDAARHAPEQPSFDPATAPQPDVFDMSDHSRDNGLVETPESSQQSSMLIVDPLAVDEASQPEVAETPAKVVKARAPRKPRKKPVPKAQAEPTGNTPASDKPAADPTVDANPSQDTAAAAE